MPSPHLDLVRQVLLDLLIKDVAVEVHAVRAWDIVARVLVALDRRHLLEVLLRELHLLQVLNEALCANDVS